MGQHHSNSRSENSKNRPSVTRDGVEGYTQGLPSYSQLSLPPEYHPRLPRQNPPINLVLQVAEHLDPVSRLCFRYTSLNLFKGLPFRVESELGKRPDGSSKLVNQVRDSGPRINQGKRAPQYDLKREGRLQLLRHFLKDGFFGDQKSICGACLDVHGDALFLPVELGKSDAERSCLGLTGKVWVCPHVSLTYEQVTCKNPLNTKWECFSCESVHVTTPSQSSSRVCFPVIRCLVADSPTDVPTTSRVVTKLASFGPASLCPHLTLSSLLSNYVQDSSPIGFQRWRCSRCLTYFNFDVKGTGRNHCASLLRLIVERDFKGIKGVTDPKWLAQLVQKEEVVEKGRTKKLYDGEPFARWEWNLDATEAAWGEVLRQCEHTMHVGDMKNHNYHGGCRGCVGKSCLRD